MDYCYSTHEVRVLCAGQRKNAAFLGFQRKTAVSNANSGKRANVLEPARMNLSRRSVLILRVAAMEIPCALMRPRVLRRGHGSSVDFTTSLRRD